MNTDQLKGAETDAPLEISPARQEISYRGTTTRLPNYTFSLLTVLASKAPAPATFAEIEEAVWSTTVTRETLKQRVKLLREALTSIGVPRNAVMAAHSVGYRLALPWREPAVPTALPFFDRPRMTGWLKPGILAAIMLAGLTAASFLISKLGTAPASAALRIAVVSSISAAEGDDEDWVEVNRLLTSRLSQLQGVDALASLSSHSFGHERARDVARALAADVILDTAVTGPDDGRRLSLQLVDGRSEAIIWSGDYDFSRDQYDRAISHFVRIAETHLDQMRGSRNDRSESVVAYFDALDLISTPTADNLDAAITRLDDVLKQKPDFVLALGLRARCEAELVLRHGRSPDRLEQALTDARSAVAREPSLAELKYALARVELASGDKRSALGHLEDAVRYMPYLDRDIQALRAEL